VFVSVSVKKPCNSRLKQHYHYTSLTVIVKHEVSVFSCQTAQFLAQTSPNSAAILAIAELAKK
jgi:hypothetical protein